MLVDLHSCAEAVNIFRAALYSTQALFTCGYQAPEMQLVQTELAVLYKLDFEVFKRLVLITKKISLIAFTFMIY